MEALETKEKGVEIQTFTTEEDINLKDLTAEKIGYSSTFFYFGETEKGESIYHGYKTTNKISEQIIQIYGESEDIKRTHENLEKKLGVKLIEFIKSKRYVEF